MRQVVLDQGDTGLTQSFPTRNDQDQHVRSRTHEHRDDVNAETLNETLLDRVRGIGRGCSIRNGSHTGFVGEKTALDTFIMAAPIPAPITESIPKASCIDKAIVLACTELKLNNPRINSKDSL